MVAHTLEGLGTRLARVSINIDEYTRERSAQLIIQFMTPQSSELTKVQTNNLKSFSEVMQQRPQMGPLTVHGGGLASQASFAQLSFSVHVEAALYLGLSPEDE